MNEKNNLAIFYIPIDRIQPNPFQPRKEFNSVALDQLSKSIKQYGVLQPIVVTKKDPTDDLIDINASYELIAGERRLRASRLAGLVEIPAVIRLDKISDETKLELAIIENLQREDLNPVDRSLAFKQLLDKFNLKQVEIANKVGKSREYVSNSLRLLTLENYMLEALKNKQISEGHTRPLLMLQDRPEEQKTLFHEIILRNLTVREAEMFARNIAVEKQKKKSTLEDIEFLELEEKITDLLGREIFIQKTGAHGGKITINFLDKGEIQAMLDRIEHKKNTHKNNVTDTGKDAIDDKAEDFVKDSNDIPNEDNASNDLYRFDNFSL